MIPRSAAIAAGIVAADAPDRAVAVADARDTSGRRIRDPIPTQLLLLQKLGRTSKPKPLRLPRLQLPLLFVGV